MLLSYNQTKEQLAGLPGWEVAEGHIQKIYTFQDFAASIKFVNKVAFLAEAANHHPDININYNKVTFTLSTHSEGGTTEKDLALAGKIQATAESIN